MAQQLTGQNNATRPLSQTESDCHLVGLPDLINHLNKLSIGCRIRLT